MQRLLPFSLLAVVGYAFGVSSCTTILGDDFKVDNGGDGDGDGDGDYVGYCEDTGGGVAACDICACSACSDTFNECYDDVDCISCVVDGISCDQVDETLLINADSCIYGACAIECST